jgi:hypothetical protein
MVRIVPSSAQPLAREIGVVAARTALCILRICPTYKAIVMWNSLYVFAQYNVKAVV